MHIDDIKRGLRAEIKNRENEQYFTCQTKENDEKEIHQTRNGSSQL